jgi:hypothetical protein
MPGKGECRYHIARGSTSVQFVVTATQTLTNDTYRAAADGNLSAVREAR